jgi:hypothetical protein
MKVQVKENAALTTIQGNNTLSLIPSEKQIEESVTIKPSTDFLPNMDFIFPIQITPDKPWLKNTAYHFGFNAGGSFQKIVEGTVLVLINTRDAAVHTPEGKDFNNREFAYAPVTIGNKTYGSTAEKFKEFLAKAQSKEVGYDWGHSSAVVVLFPDGKAAMLDFTSVKTPDSYLYNILFPALLVTKTGLRIDITDHTPDLVKSKAGYFYPKASKFQQWEHIQLSEEQMKAALSAIELSRGGYEKWLNQ